MGAYFLDTSAIVKRYCLERGQAWVRSLCNPLQGHVLFISQAALVEGLAAENPENHSFLAEGE